MIFNNNVRSVLRLVNTFFAFYPTLILCTLQQQQRQTSVANYIDALPTTAILRPDCNLHTTLQLYFWPLVLYIVIYLQTTSDGCAKTIIR